LESSKIINEPVTRNLSKILLKSFLTSVFLEGELGTKLKANKERRHINTGAINFIDFIL
jgi:hypothetical protein